ncbi:MAG: L,D-transpeptidase family protein [Pseudomonadota bacterium]
MLKEFTSPTAKALRTIVLPGLAAGLVLSLTLPEPVSAQSFNRTFNFGTVYKTAPSKSERVTSARHAVPMISPRSAQAMYDAISRYEIIVRRGGWPKVSAKRPLVIGAKSKYVRRLRQRLAIERYLPAGASANSKKFDQNLFQAVKRFQMRHGLAATGKVDKQTLAVLNVPAGVRLQQLRENLPRIQEYSKNLGGRYVLVNIPAAQLESVAFGQVYSRHNVVVGKPSRPSPVLASNINQLNFNPYWNAPVSIVAKDILPKVRKNPGWLKTMRIRVFDGHGGPEVNPRNVNWSSVAPDRFHFRQDPGGENAMASVKINFPNKYAVYLHDTPSKGLFKRPQRFFSSGCVRVDKVHILTNWLLQGQQGWNTQRIRAVAASERPTDVELYSPAQLRMVYLTAWALPDGSVHFRPDVYRLDGSGFVKGQPRPTGREAAAEARVYSPSGNSQAFTPPASTYDNQDQLQGNTTILPAPTQPPAAQGQGHNFSRSAADQKSGKKFKPRY